MALGPRLELKQNQQLSMTPQLRQAISLLQMTNLELAAYLVEEVEKNPLLEMKEPEADVKDASQSAEQRVGSSFIEIRSAASDDFDFLQNIEKPQSLREILRQQIQISDRDMHRVSLALALVDELDERGFLGTPVFEITDRLGVSQSDIEHALELLQSCEPAGVGARNLSECLELQLRDTGKFDPVMQVLTANLGAVAKAEHGKLAKLADVSVPVVKQAIGELQKLNPKPANGYDVEFTQTAAPDILVNKSPAGGWTVELVTESLPKVLFNEQYAAEIAKDGSLVKEFLIECNANARFLIKAMDQRAKTILRVATVIVRHQNRFFDLGISGLRPLTLAAIAEELGIHESTVSRVTSGKFLYCLRGNFELRFFFAQGISRTDGREDIAAPVVREKIRELVAAEPPNQVLSDENIAKLLQDDGVDVARRTVAKYREVMGIPPSNRRRKQKV